MKPINNAITIAVPDSEKLIKWDLLKKLISDCNNDTEENKNTLDKFQGAHTYILLAAIYKIDYLIKPESKIMEYIENADKDYFIDKSTDLTSKIKLLQECINNISEIPQSQFNNEIYNVVSTFSWTNHSSHSQIKDVIEAELKTFNWFYENKNYNICEAICSYIVGYLLYHFSLIPPIKELLQFYLELVEPQFFSKLNGYTTRLVQYQTIRPSIGRGVISAIGAFFKWYLFSGAWRQGKVGVVTGLYATLYSFLKYFKAWYQFEDKK